MNLPTLIRIEAKENLLKTARSIIEGKVNIVEATRDLLSYANSAEIYEDEVFLPIIGFVSETDEYPIGEVRKRFNKEYLKELDKDLNKYIKICRKGLVEDCEQIIEKFQMDKIDKVIEERFKEKAISQEAGELLFDLENSLDVIDEVEKQKAIILGIDFWKNVDGGFMEINSTAWEEIYYGDNPSEETIKAARDMLKNGIPEGDYISFVFADKETEL